MMDLTKISPLKRWAYVKAEELVKLIYPIWNDYPTGWLAKKITALAEEFLAADPFRIEWRGHELMLGPFCLGYIYKECKRYWTLVGELNNTCGCSRTFASAQRAVEEAVMERLTKGK